MNTAREGADGVLVLMDETTSSQVARVLIAGGRTSNTAGAYETSAESIGIFADGSFETSWSDESSQFTHARAFYALVTTQDKDVTPFPPDPEEPPCSADLDGDGFFSCNCTPPNTPPEQLDCNDGDAAIHPGADDVCEDGIDQDCDLGCTGTDPSCDVIDRVVGGDSSLVYGRGRSEQYLASAWPSPGDGVSFNLRGADPVYVVAVQGDDDFQSNNNAGRQDFEACQVQDSADLDADDDGAANVDDNCPVVANSDQADADADGFGDLCDTTDGTDVDSDTVANADDNCAEVSNTDQADADGDDLGDLCDTTGLLACSQWAVQTAGNTPQDAFGMDALLYFDYLYACHGIRTETITTTVSRTMGGAISRFPVTDPASVVGDQVTGGYQNASVSPEIDRGYYKMARLLGYIYYVGGWTSSGPTGTIERHPQ
jgi:hypothetical protein